MTWVTALYETYENCSNSIGKSESDAWSPLLPLCHTIQKTQIQITLDRDGNFQDVDEKDLKKEETIIIPCTVESEARSSGNSPHALCDNLKYLSADAFENGKSTKDYYEKYIEELRKWCSSRYSHPKAKAILNYLEKNTILSDIKNSIDDKYYQKILKSPKNYYVRFSVFEGDETRTWEDESLRQSFIDYYLNEVINNGENSLCYASGELLPVSRLSPRAVRWSGDGAYLICENKNALIYKGRFATREETSTLSYDVSQKVHKVLRWLIDKQGYKNGDLVYVTWGLKNEKIPQITNPDDLNQQNTDTVDTADVFADQMGKALAGYRQKLNPDANIVVMGLDSTNGNKGRLSIIYYQELLGSEFLNRIIRWYETTKWYPMPYKKKTEEKPDGVTVKITACPTPHDIFFASYGKETESTKKLKKSTVSRIMPCIIEGKPIPQDLVYSSANRAAKLIFAGKNDSETDKTLSIACSLIRKNENDSISENKRNDFEHYREVWKMTLDETQTDRSYLFGRLLAYAREIERFSNFSAGNKPRQTNAERAIVRFRQHPRETWDALYQKLNDPYMARFRMFSPDATGNRLEREMNEITSSFKFSDFSDEPLSPVYLLGYQSQMAKFDIARKEKNQNRDDENDNLTE